MVSMDRYLVTRPVLEYAVPAEAFWTQFISVRAGLSIILPMLHYLFFNYFRIDSDSFGLVVDGDQAWLNFATNLVFYAGPFVLCVVLALHAIHLHKPPLSSVNYHIACFGIAINTIAGASQVISVYTGWYGYL